MSTLQSHKRSGIATLEFVLALPFLLALFGAIYAIATAGVNQGSLSIATRHDGWTQAASKSAEPLNYLKIDAAKEIARHNAQKSFSILQLFDRRTVNASSQFAVVSNSWAHKKALNDPNGVLPHKQLLKPIVLDGGTSGDGGISGFDDMFANGKLDAKGLSEVMGKLDGFNDAIGDALGTVPDDLEHIIDQIFDNQDSANGTLGDLGF